MPRVQRAGGRKRAYIYDDFKQGTNIARDPLPVAEDAPLNREYRFFRPVWMESKGSPNFPSGSNRVELRANNRDAIARFSTFDTGTWEFDFQMGSDPTAGTIRAGLLWEDVNNNWDVRIDHSGSLELFKNGSSQNSANLADLDTSEHTIEVTRDVAGNWEVFYDGTSQFTVADTFLPDYYIFFIEHFNMDAETRLNRVEIY